MDDSLHLNAKNARLSDLERKLATPVAYTLSAKLELQEQLRETANEAGLAELNADIKGELVEIEQMEYLSRLGYRCIGDPYGFIIKCKTSSIWMDVIGIIIGMVFTSSIASAIGTSIAVSSGMMPFEMGTMFGILGGFALGTLGLLLFIRSLSRLVDHSGFELIKSDGQITLSKRVDFTKEEIQVTSNEVKLQKQGKKMWIELGETKVFEVEHPDVYDRKTLEALYERLAF